MKTLKLYFPQDAYVNGELVYKKGLSYDVKVSEGTADRWIKRGAIPESQMPKEEAKEEVITAPVTESDKEEISEQTVVDVEAPKETPKSKKSSKK